MPDSTLSLSAAVTTKPDGMTDHLVGRASLPVTEPTSDLVSLAAHCRYYQGIIQNDSSALNKAFPCEVKFMSSLTMDGHWVSHK